jgi:type II secretory pathway component PulM
MRKDMQDTRKVQTVVAQTAKVDLTGEEARRAEATAIARKEKFAVAALQGVLAADVSEPSLSAKQVAEYAMDCAMEMYYLFQATVCR